MASKRIVRVVCASCGTEIYREREGNMLAARRTSALLIRQAAAKHPCGGEVRYFVGDQEFTGQKGIEDDAERLAQREIIRKCMGVP